MRIALISIDPDYIRFLYASLFVDGGYMVFEESTHESFEKKFGPLDNYDGLIYHPGIQNQRDIGSIVKEHPNLPMMIVTRMKRDEPDLAIPVFSYTSEEAILAYIRTHWKERVL